MKHRRSLLCVLCLVACSSADPEESAGPEGSDSPIRRVETKFDVRWKDGTVVLDEKDLASALLDREATDGVYRFASTSGLASKLAVGDVVVMTGIDLVKITRIEASRDVLAVHTEPASIPDAAEEADMAFDLTGVLPTLAASSRAPNDLTPTAKVSLSPDGRRASFSGDIDGFSVTMNYERTDQTLETALGITYKKDEALLTFSGKGNMKAFDTRSSLQVREGKTSAFALNVDNLDIMFELEAGVVATGKGVQKFTIPFVAKAPFTVGPIPMYVGVSVGVEMESALATQSSLLFRVKCHSTGSLGVHYAGGSLSTNGDMEKPTCTAVPTSYLAPSLDGGFAFRVDLPKITIGTGLPSGAKLPQIGSIDTSAEGYASVLHEVVGNLKIRREAAGNAPVITGTCYDLAFNRALMAGANFRFAGVNVKNFEKQIFGENVAHEKMGAGKGCAE